MGIEDQDTTKHDNYLVVQSNRLVEASQTMTLNEKRLVILAASMIDSRKPMEHGHRVTIAASDYAKLFGLTGGSAYTTVANAAKMLFNRTIRSIERTGKNAGNERNVRWVWMCDYLKSESSVVLGFSPIIAPYLSLLNENFTQYRISSVRRLSTLYAIRIYEMACQYKKLGRRRIELEDFRTMMDVGDKYSEFKNLRKRVIDPSVEEINRLSDLHVAFNPIYQGRKVIAFDIDVSEREFSGSVVDEAGAEQQETEAAELAERKVQKVAKKAARKTAKKAAKKAAKKVAG